jgi:hypothetical protein
MPASELTDERGDGMACGHATELLIQLKTKLMNELV